MNWLTQVGHVAAKDLRQSRWSIAVLFVAAIAAATGFVTRSALGPIMSANTMTLGMSDWTVAWLPITIVLVGVIALAVLVQSDRPLQADSFWATRPLSPTALLAAKLLVAVMVITVPSLIGALVSLEAFRTPRVVAASMLAHAALVHLAVLLGAAVLAALTEEMKGFVTASVLLLVGFLAVGSLADSVFAGAFSVPSALAFCAPAAAVLLLASFYSRRLNGPKAWIAGFVVASALVLGTVVAPALTGASVPMLATGPQVSFTFVGPASTNLALPFSIRVGDTSSARYAFARDRTVISDAQETRRLTPLHDTITVGSGLPDLGRPIRWLTPRFSLPTLASLALSPADSHAVASAIGHGAASANLNGTVTVLRPRVLAALPLRVGAFAERDGRFISIYGVSHDSVRASVYVHTVSPPLPERHLPQFALVNYARGEAVLLDEHPSSGSGSGWVVLPWISVTSWFDQFTTNSQTPVPHDDAWYDGASLVAVDWIPAARYRASGTMPLH